MTRRPARPSPHRIAGAALLGSAIGGAGLSAHAVALSEVRLWLAVLLVQALALAAVAGVALLMVPPGLASRAAPEA